MFFWSGVTLAVAVVCALVAGAVLGGMATQQLEHATWLPSQPPPARLVACRFGPSPGCARKAAKRVGVPIAWTMPPESFTLGWLMAMPRTSERHTSKAFTLEHLTSADAVIELETNPQYPMTPGEGDHVEEMTTPRGWAVRVIEAGGPTTKTVSMEWAKYGVTYRLFAAPMHIVGNAVPSTDELLRLVDAVQYELPAK